MKIDNLRTFLKDAVIKAQHCQRNWDLNEQIPKEDLDLMVHSVTQCPSKQNMDFYEVFVIQDADTKNKIYDTSLTCQMTRKNPQLLANALFVFVEKVPTQFRTPNARKLWLEGARKNELFTEWKNYHKDQNQAVGVAAGFLNMVATSLGYSTGCNTCMDLKEVANILKIEDGRLPILAMGIGFKDKNRNRRHEHYTDVKIGTNKKLEIPVHYID
jgi:nitroreductase